MKNEMKDEATTLYLALLETLFGEVPRLTQAIKSGPWDGVLDAREKLIEAYKSVCDIAHRLSNLDDTRAISLMLLESYASQEIIRLTHYDAKAAVVGA